MCGYFSLVFRKSEIWVQWIYFTHVILIYYIAKNKNIMHSTMIPNISILGIRDTLLRFSNSRFVSNYHLYNVLYIHRKYVCYSALGLLKSGVETWWTNFLYKIKSSIYALLKNINSYYALQQQLYHFGDTGLFLCILLPILSESEVIN